MLTVECRFIELMDSLIKNNFVFFTSVPDSLLNFCFKELEKHEKLVLHVSALREDIALGIAAGSVMSGAKSVVLMQNSGLGVCVNALASLILPFKIPILMIIGHRGDNEMDTEENLIMGRITEKLLMTLNIKTKSIFNENIIQITNWVLENIDKGNSVAILIQQSEMFNLASGRQ